MADYIILMGMQGAGKGTQAEVLSHATGLPHVTSGGMLRAIKEQPSDFGRAVKAYYDPGLYVPDEMMVEIIRRRLAEADAKNGVILDGYPRTVPQAETLDKLLGELGGQVTVVPYLIISEVEALDRLSGRLVCTLNDNHTYNIKDQPPKTPGFCDIDGAPLKVRDDDTPDAIRQRISEYKVKTQPVLDYYRNRHLLREINAEQPIDRVTADLKVAIDGTRHVVEQGKAN